MSNTIIHAEFKHLLLFQHEVTQANEKKICTFKTNSKLQIKM